MPPSVLADGLGSCAAGNVPEVILEAEVVSVVPDAARPVMSAAAGRALLITPAAEIAVRKLLVAPVSGTTVVLLALGATLTTRKVLAPMPERSKSACFDESLGSARMKSDPARA